MAVTRTDQADAFFRRVFDEYAVCEGAQSVFKGRRIHGQPVFNFELSDEPPEILKIRLKKSSDGTKRIKNSYEVRIPTKLFQPPKHLKRLASSRNSSDGYWPW